MNSKTRMEEREIDLLKVLWDMAEQWKPIIVVSLVCACLMASVMYVKDLRSYQASVAVSDVDVEDVEDGLTEEEIADINYAVSIHENLIEKQEYLNDSVWVNLYSNEVNVLRTQYYITSDSNHNGIPSLYSSYLSDENFLKELKDSMGLDVDIDEKYVGELISTNVSSYDVESFAEGTQDVNALIVRIILPEDANADDASKVLDQYILENAYGIVSQSVPHSIAKVGSVEATEVMPDITDYRTDLTNTIASLESSLTTATGDFSDDQTTVYEALISDDEDMASETTDEKAAMEDDTESAENSADAEESIIPPSFSLKYFALGFIVGIVLYAGILVLIEIFNKTITDAMVVEDMYGVRVLEAIHAKRPTSAWEKFMHSTFVQKLRYKKESKDYAGRIDAVKDEVTEYINHKGYEKASYLPVGNSEGMVDVSLTAGILTGELSETSPVVLVIRSGVSKFEELQDMLVKASDFDRQVVGAIFIEE